VKVNSSYDLTVTVMAIKVDFKKKAKKSKDTEENDVVVITLPVTPPYSHNSYISIVSP